MIRHEKGNYLILFPFGIVQKTLNFSETNKIEIQLTNKKRSVFFDYQELF